MSDLGSLAARDHPLVPMARHTRQVARCSNIIRPHIRLVLQFIFQQFQLCIQIIRRRKVLSQSSVNLVQVHHRVRHMICHDLHRINDHILLECRDDLYIDPGRRCVDLANIELLSHDHIAFSSYIHFFCKTIMARCYSDFLVADRRVFLIFTSSGRSSFSHL